MAVTANGYRLCSVDDCGRRLASKGLCQTHYQRVRLTGNLNPDRPVRPAKAIREGDKKQCGKCSELKLLHDFNRNRQMPDGRHNYCKVCVSETKRRIYRSDSPSIIEKQRWKQVKYRYGITREQYEQMLESQGGVCAICNAEPEPDRYLSVDHNHACCSNGRKGCGRCIRGLLCTSCNSIIGLAQDSTDRLDKAVAYLQGNQWQ